MKREDKNFIIFIIVIIITVLGVIKAQGQGIHFGDTKQSNIGILIDPRASYKESGINIGAEIDYRENGLYIHSGLQSFAKIEGDYVDWTTGIGTNLNIGYFDDLRFYGGGRLGLIFRGGNTYPTVGAEIGTDYVFKNGISIGLRTTYDYRSDFEFWGGTPEMRLSTFIKLGIKL